MTAGLSVPYAAVFGDPEALPIVSARVGEIVLLAPYADGECILFNMPTSAMAFELSAIASGTDDAIIAYIVTTPTGAGDVEAAVADGLHRLVPGSGQVIEQRGSDAGDVLIVKVLSGAVDLRVHAHIGV